MREGTSDLEERTFSLRAEQASYIDRLVASGTFASASEVIQAGLLALQERDPEVERWLREDVVPVFDEMKADPSRARPLAEVRDRLHARHLARLRDVAG